MNSAIIRYKICFSTFVILFLTLSCSKPLPTQTTPISPDQSHTSTSVGVSQTTLNKPSTTPGNLVRNLNFGGQERSYILHIPPNYNPAQPTPLVLAYHGFDLNAQEMIRISGFSDQADKDNFLVAYPEGSGNRKSWNGGECCGEAMIRKVDDVGFTRAIINDVATFTNIDRSRVFATGFSNGAIMAYRLACDLADQIAAVGPVAAAPATQSCSPSRPVSVIHFHGDADKLNPFEGGKGTGVTEFMPVEDGIALWRDLDGCMVRAQETNEENIVHSVYAPCQEKTAIELYKILGGEHAWPGGEAVSAQIGKPTEKIDATALIWEFFQAHPKP